MRKLITCGIAAILASASLALAAPPDKATLMEKEQAAWQAFKDKKADDFKNLLAADVKAVYADGIADLEKEIASMQKWDMKSFQISDYNVTNAGPDTVVSTYTVKVEGTLDGKDASGTYYAGSVWHEQGGSWQAIFHTNIVAEAQTK